MERTDLNIKKISNQKLFEFNEWKGKNMDELG